MQIRKTSENDFDAMWNIFQSVVATGDTLPFDGNTSEDFFRAQWMGDDNNSYVALENTDVLGMYKTEANYPGLGNHVASATYLVSPSAQGKGVGGALVKHSLAQAASAGFWRCSSITSSAQTLLPSICIKN